MSFYDPLSEPRRLSFDFWYFIKNLIGDWGFPFSAGAGWVVGESELSHTIPKLYIITFPKILYAKCVISYSGSVDHFFEIINKMQYCNHSFVITLPAYRILYTAV